MKRLINLLHRARAAIAALLNPWREVRLLREENARLMDTLSNPSLTGVNIGNGSVDVGLQGHGPALLAGMFLGLFEKHPEAKNYIECRFSSPQGPIVVTAMRPGGKTPDQLRREAERKLSELTKG